MYINCDAGVASTNRVGSLPGVGTIGYNPNGIASIIPILDIQIRFQVT